MKFIKKKNMQEGEELLYTPRLHWVFMVRHVVRALPFIAVLYAVWYYIDPSLTTGFDNFRENLEESGFLIPAVLAVVLLVLAWGIFQFLCTEYGVTNKRLLMKKGVFRISTAEIPTDRIESFYCVQSIVGRIFNYGTISISGVGGMTPVFYMVARPYAFRRKVIDIIERNKGITVVHGDIPIPPVKETKVKKEPIYRYGTFVRVLRNDQ